MTAWVLPVGLGVVLPLTALIDASRVPSSDFARAGRSKANTIAWLCILPVLAAAYYWISVRWLVARSGDHIESPDSSSRTDERCRGLLARSAIASVALAVL